MLTDIIHQLKPMLSTDGIFGVVSFHRKWKFPALGFLEQIRCKILRQKIDYVII
jgi:hypothetical protein